MLATETSIPKTCTLFSKYGSAIRFYKTSINKKAVNVQIQVVKASTEDNVFCGNLTGKDVCNAGNGNDAQGEKKRNKRDEEGTEVNRRIDMQYASLHWGNAKGGQKDLKKTLHRQ